MRKYAVIFCSLVCLFLVSQCQRADSKYSEGYIVYNISYLNQKSSKLIGGFLPRTMVVKFKDDKYILMIGGFMGIFSFGNICQEKSNTTFIHVFNHKYMHQGDKGEWPAYFMGNSARYHFVFDHSTERIAGCLCKKAIVKTAGGQSFTVFFTDQIRLKRPNSTNPYAGIDGVLMDFRITWGRLDMQLKAKKVVFGSVSENDFTIPGGYQNISKASMQKVLCLLTE